MYQIDQSTQTVFADLNQRTMDATFDADFPENGNFHVLTIKGRGYWYYNGYDAVTGKKTKKYVGPKSDPEVTKRVEQFAEVKDSKQARSDAVRMLKAAGLPTPDTLTGALLDALAATGFFRLRGVLVGTIAFQTYPGLVGARPDRNLNTGDIDLAVDHGISIALDDQTASLLEAVQSIDKSFEPRPSLDGFKSSAFINKRGYQIDFLVPNRGSDDQTSKITSLPTLGGQGATPLRYLDFLILNPVRSVVLHGAGVPVRVPAPERYAVHKLIVATQREDREKITKDLGQAAFLIEALSILQFDLIALAWAEAWGRGPQWRTALKRGRGMLPETAANTLTESIQRAAASLDIRAADIGF